MSQQKLTIALIGEDIARADLKAKIIHFAQNRDQEHTKQSLSIPTNPDYVLQGFLFEGCIIDIVEVTKLEPNRPEFDGAFLATIPEIDLPLESNPLETESHSVKKQPKALQTKEEMLDETLEELKKPIPKDSLFKASDARENPYFCLAEKLNCTAEALATIYLTKGTNHSSKKTLQDENSENIANNLKKLIDSNRTLARMKQALARRALPSNKTHSSHLAENTTAQTWYGKHRGLLGFFILTFIGTIGTLIGFLLANLLFTPFAAIPTVLLVFTTASLALLRIKIRYGNACFESLSPIADQSTADHPDTEEPNQHASPKSIPVLKQERIDLRANSLKDASVASKKLKSILTNNSKSKADNFEISIIFDIEDNGQIFLNCSNSNPHRPQAIQNFQHFEQLLKNLFPNENIPINHIPITKILDLPDELVTQQKNSLSPVYT